MIVPPQRRLSTDHADGLPGGELLTSPSRAQADEGEGARLADSADGSDRLPLNHANSTVVDEATSAGLRSVMVDHAGLDYRASARQPRTPPHIRSLARVMAALESSWRGGGFGPSGDVWGQEGSE